MTDKKHLIIIDSNSVIHRAFHALPPLTNKEGGAVNAVYGYLLVLFKAVKDFHPDFIAACFDFPAPTFRHKKFKEYKAGRPRAPEALISQFSKVEKILEAFSIPVFKKEGFEADDLIATISKKSSKDGMTENIILSGDSDSFQLIDDLTRTYFLRKGVKNTVLYDKKKIKEEYGLEPLQLLDFKALRGDPSDNIKGVKGIGEKTALSLIQEFGNVESLYEGLEKSPAIKPNVKKLLSEQREQAFLSKDLVALNRDAPIDFDLEKCRYKYDKEKATEALQDLNFHSLVSRLDNMENNSEGGQQIGKNLRLL